jgi:hypothetical protein
MKLITKALISGAAATVVFGGTYGLAASLGLTSDTLGAGTAVVAACQATPLNATYTGTTYAAAVPGYQETSVTVTGLATTCWSKPYKVTLYGAAGASLGEVTGTTPGSGTTITVTPFAGVGAAAVTGVAVVISG